MREHLEDIVYENGVDLYIAGHLHNYERNSPIYKNETVKSDYDDFHTHINAKAPVYILSGVAGNNHKKNDPLSTTPALWSRVRSLDYGVARLKVFNSSALYFE